jgi:hemoglobin/transferrin/lactoferrin receptor protein
MSADPRYPARPSGIATPRLLPSWVPVLLLAAVATGIAAQAPSGGGSGPAVSGAAPSVPAPQEKPPAERAVPEGRDPTPQGEKTPGESAQETSAVRPGEERRVHDVGTMVITASRVKEAAFEIPRSMTIVDQIRLRERDSLSVLDSLDDQIGIWVDKYTTTTSDPVIRGLSGTNLSALIDGNTISTFWGEGGLHADDMYGKIDADTVERIEVLRGPASVQYGSNALGGVLNFITRSSPIDYTEDAAFRAGGRVRGVFGSAAKEWRFRGETFGATSSFKYLVGWSRRDADDLNGGRGVGVQDPTSGEDCNVDAKVQWRTTDNSELTVSAQSVTRRHLHRFYRPAEDNFNYRQGYSATWEVREPTTFWEEVRANAYYQYKEDKRRWFSSGDHGRALWRTFTADLQAVSRIGDANRLTYGLGVHRDYGESPDDEQFTVTQPDGTKTKASPDTLWDNFGMFAMDRWDVTDALAFTAGVRFDWFRFDADPDQYYNPPSGRPDLDDFTDRETAFTGGLGVIYEVTPDVRVFGDYSRGFRQFAPKFGVTQHAYGVIVPSQFLDPVTADNFEVGTRWATAKWRGSLAAYYTNFDNFQNIVRGTFMGQDWFDYNNNTIRDPDEDVYVTTGNGDAYVYGVEVEMDFSLGEFFPEVFGPEWSVGGGFMWNYGRDVTADIPLRHTHPARGLLKIRWDDTDAKRGLWWEFCADFVRHFDRVPPSRQASDPAYRRNPQDPASGPLRHDGIPGYSVFDVRGGVNVNEHATITLAVENLTDKKYRTAHSRIDAAGINFQAALDIHF